MRSARKISTAFSFAALMTAVIVPPALRARAPALGPRAQPRLPRRRLAGRLPAALAPSRRLIMARGGGPHR